MFSRCSTLTNLSKSIHPTYQSVRWRKPSWLPMAKSKVFKVPPRRRPPVEEEAEMKRLYNNYRTELKSLASFLEQKHSVQYQTSTDPEELRKAFEEDFERCKALNDEWNETQRVCREKFFSERLEERLAMARRKLEEGLIEKERQSEEIEAVVRKLKEEAEHFIRREDVDAAIEQALENPIDYNYAIDTNGQKIVGRENNSLQVAEKVPVQQ